MNYIVAVSGGVDSVVLLDMLASGRWTMEDGRLKTASTLHSLSSTVQYIVAHFDHGIRDESATDARFVAALAKQYGLLYETRREELGRNASEATARARRYTFLRDIAKKHSATIVTAHHADDVVETIAINLYRGTEWRGLAVLDSADIERPLLTMTKRNIYEYAIKNNLEWVEDSTNREVVYLRNRLRYALHQSLSDEAHATLLDLHTDQRMIRHQIHEEITTLLERQPIDRYFLIQSDTTVARELLQALIYQQAGKTLTWPQVDRALLMVKSARPGVRHDIGDNIRLRFRSRDIIVETP